MKTIFLLYSYFIREEKPNESPSSEYIQGHSKTLTSSRCPRFTPMFKFLRHRRSDPVSCPCGVSGRVSAEAFAWTNQSRPRSSTFNVGGGGEHSLNPTLYGMTELVVKKPIIHFKIV